jgi:serine protease Do
MRRFTAYGPAFVVLVTTLVTLFAAPAAVRHIGYANSETQIRLARLSLENDDILERINAATRNIAVAVEPSVVHIAIEASDMRGRGSGVRLSQGSGWVFDTQGHIVTNAHVVRDAPRIVVQFHDGRQLPASIVGVDPSTDIAVLRVNTNEGLFAAERATGVEVRQGDRVYAFGSPFGFKFSMSEGIVSGLGRDPRAVINTPGGGYTNFIQTDAAVNPGNSGGPLVDIRGRVVGMNVAIATAGSTRDGEGQNSGISFAIPLETIEHVVSQLITNGAVARGFMGIEMPGPGFVGGRDDPDAAELANRELMERAGYTGRGVYVTRVIEDGPAARAGMRSGDIITQFAGRDVATITGLRSAITVNPPGQRTSVRVWRSGRTLDLSVVLADLARNEPGIRNADEAFAHFGLRWEPRDKGVAVTDVDPQSDAAAAGFRPGQVIIRVGDREVAGARDFLANLASSGFINGRELRVTVVDPDGKQREVPLRYVP